MSCCPAVRRSWPKLSFPPTCPPQAAGKKGQRAQRRSKRMGHNRAKKASKDAGPPQ